MSLFKFGFSSSSSLSSRKRPSDALTEEKTKESKKKYDQETRKRSFQESWKKNHEWLIYHEEKNTMHCEWCMDYAADSDKKSAFAAGCSSFRYDSIVAHQKSELHLKSTEWQNAKKGSTDDSSAGKGLKMLHASVAHRLVHLFRNTHALVMNRRPFTDFVFLCTLDEKKGVDIGQTYRNDKQAVTFARFIAKAERQKFLERVKMAHGCHL